MGVRSTELDLEPYCQGCKDIIPDVVRLDGDDGTSMVYVRCLNAGMCWRLVKRIMEGAGTDRHKDQVQVERPTLRDERIRGPLDG